MKLVYDIAGFNIFLDSNLSTSILVRGIKVLCSGFHTIKFLKGYSMQVKGYI